MIAGASLPTAGMPAGAVDAVDAVVPSLDEVDDVDEPHAPRSANVRAIERDVRIARVWNESGPSARRPPA